MTTKKIKTSDILGDNYYIYELTSSNYTPALNGSITITCIMKDVYGTAISGESITLYQNGTSKGAQTTNSSGIATWSITCSNAGIQSFKVGNKTIEVFVDELMTVRTVTPTINSGGSSTMNNVTKNWHYSRINSSDLEYFERIVYNITFEDNDFQMFYQVIPSMGGGGNSDIKIIYFDGTDCYWGIPNNEDLTKGSLICEGNTIQATLNKDMTITIGDTITNWEIGGGIIMFGNVDFTYTIYSHKYLDNETFPYVFEYQEANKYSDDEDDEYTINSTTKNIGEYYFNGSSLNNIIETTYTFTFNDNDFSFLQINYDYPIFFDGTDCYWGEWDENDHSVLNKGTLICEGNIVQAVNKSTDGSNEITFSDGTSTNLSPETYYFGDVSVKRINKAPKLEYAQNKKQSLFSSYYDESIVYPSVNAVKNYAENKSNKTSSWNSTTDNTRYPTEKLVKDSLDLKSDNTHTHTVNLNLSNVYDADNWTTIDGNAPTITSDSIQANAVSHHILNKEFVESKYYTLTFEFNIDYSNRSGFYLFGDEDCNRMFEIVTDIGNTVTLQYDSNGNTTELYVGTKNHFTRGWHDIKVIRKGATATLYIDDELYYTFNNIGNCTNLFGLFKWAAGSTTIKNVNVSLDVTEFPVDYYVDKSELEDYIEKDNLKTIEGANLIGSGDIAIELRKNSNVIFEDKGSPNRISNYGTMPHREGSTNSSFTISYDRNEQAYSFAGECCITPLTGITDDFKLEVDMKRTVNNEWCGLSFDQNIGNGFFYGGCNGYWQGHYYQNNSWRGSISGGGTSSIDTWYHLELKKEGTTITINAYDIDRVIKLRSTSRTYNDSDNYYGIILTGYFKNLKAEYLNNDSPIDLSTDKTVLSFYDNESATLTTTYKAGAIIDLYDADTMTRIGNFTEDNGTYTYNYASTGKGNINLVAKVGSQISEPICIEDCLFYGINTDAFDIPEDATFSSDSEKITATTSTSGEKLVYFNHDFNQNDNFLFESEIAELGVYQVTAMNWNDVDYYGGQYGGTNRAYTHLTSSDAWISHTFAVGDKYTVIRKDEITFAYINNDLISSANCSYNTTFKVGFFINPDRTQYYKNIKIKIMNDVIPYAPQLKNTIYLEGNYVEKNNLKTIEGVNLIGNEDIAIDVSCDYNAIFEDECNSNENIGEYGTVKSIYGSTTTGTMEYDSTYNGYALNRTGTSSNTDATIMFPITSMTGKKNLIIEADIQSQHIAYNRIGFGCVDKNGTTAYVTIGHDAWSSALRFFYGNHSSVNAISSDYSLSNQWYHIVMIVQGNSYSAELYSDDSLLTTVQGTYELDIATREVGIMLGCPSNSTCWVKNIKVQPYSILFKDEGVTGNVNTDYTDVGGTINTAVSATGTTITCSTYADCVRIPNVKLSGDFEITYTLVALSGPGGGFFILNNNTTINNYIAYIESNTSQGWNINYGGDQWQSISASLPYDVKITRVGSTFTVYVDNTQVNQRDITSGDIYMGWKTHSSDGRSYTFKDFVIKYIDSESTIHLGDGIMTMINTALKHIITNWEDYE